MVKDINEERMIIEYANGEHEFVSLLDKVEKNSSSGFYIDLKLDTDLKVGSKVKKGDVVAYDNLSFSDKSGEGGDLAYNIGTIAKVAILNTDDGFEDSTIVSDALSKAMSSEIVLALPDKVLAKTDNIYNMVKKGQKVQDGDVLFFIQDTDDEDMSVLLRNLAGTEDDLSELGRTAVYSNVTGIVQDIRIYRTVDLDELSPSLKKLVNSYESGIKTRLKELKSYGIKNAETLIPMIGKQPATGRLKHAADSVLIEIYLKYKDDMSPGDKIVFYSANKGVIGSIFPIGKEPRSDYRPKERIDALGACSSINARMVTSIITNGTIYKGLIELSRQCKDILGLPYKENLLD